MSTIHQILREIDSLDEVQRQELERELAARAQAEWEEVTSEARAEAAKRGIDQAAIDRAIQRRRHG